jgi:hypothetical protein
MNTMEYSQHGIMKTSSVTEVKIFVQKDATEAEKAIAAWLKQNKVLIHHIGQSQSEKGGAFLFIISVFYSQLEG